MNKAIGYARIACINQNNNGSQMENNNSIGYTRVSTHEQAKDGNSIEIQKQNIERYCYLKELNLLEIITEPGVSAGIPLHKRTGGQSLLELMYNKDVNHIIVTKLDRLFRDADDCLSTIKEWEKFNIGLHIIDLGGLTINTKETAGKLFLSIMAVMAEWEKNVIRDRTREAMQQLILNKKYTGGKVPFGFKIGENNELESNEKEKEVISIICSMRAEGATVTEIHKKLVELNIGSRGNKPICNAQIVKILRKNKFMSEKPKTRPRKITK